MLLACIQNLYAFLCLEHPVDKGYSKHRFMRKLMYIFICEDVVEYEISECECLTMVESEIINSQPLS